MGTMLTNMDAKLLNAQAEVRHRAMNGARLSEAIFSAAARYGVDAVSVATLACEALVATAVARTVAAHDRTAERRSSR